MICNSYDVFFKTLADPAKLDILNLLTKQSLSVSQLCKKLNFEQSRVSHNLKTLTERGFVDVARKGKQRIYSVEQKTVLPLLGLIDVHVEKYYKHYCECKGIPWRKRT